MFEWKQPPAPDPYVTHIAHGAIPEQQPPCFAHWRARGRRGGGQGHVKVVSKIRSGFWVLAAALGALEWLGELKFLWRLPGSPFLLLIGAVCLALCGVLFLEPL